MKDKTLVFFLASFLAKFGRSVRPRIRSRAPNQSGRSRWPCHPACPPGWGKWAWL